MIKSWDDEAWADYLYWQTQDKKTLKRINYLLKDIDRQPYSGIGKPEPLTGISSAFIIIISPLIPWYMGHGSAKFGRITINVYRFSVCVVETSMCFPLRSLRQKSRHHLCIAFFRPFLAFLG